MKKFFLLTKTLLVAVCLLVGATNAWADVVYSWEGSAVSAKESGGTAVGTLNVLHTTVAGNLYAMQIAGNSSNIGAGGGVTITLTEALQEGDVIRVTGFQDKNESGKVTALYMSFDQDATNKGNISDTENWVNLNTAEGCATGTQPETKIYTVTAALAGSNKLTLIRTSGQTGTNLFINKFQIYRNPTVNADINFSNAISDKAVAGTVNSMALSNTSGNQPFELGYTSGTPATTVLENVLRVGSGTGTVTIEDSELARARDIVVISFDMYFGNNSGRNAGFYLYDGSGAEIGGFYRNFYDGTNSTNTFGFDVSKITSLGKSGTENDKICVNTNKTTFEIHLDYSTGKMYAVQSTNGTVKQKTTPVAMLSNNPIKKFVVKSNYSSDNRRCWFDNLKIQTYAGRYGSPKTITYNYKDNSDNDITDFMTSHGGNSSDTGEMDEEYTPQYPSIVTTDDYVYDYTYASGGDAFTVTSDKTITLIYNKTDHPTVDVKLKRMIGGVQYGDLITVAEDYLEGKPIIYGFSKYIIDDGKLYKANAPYAVETAASSTPIEITYTEQTVTGTPVYFGEKGGAPSNTEWANYSGGTTTSAAEVELIPASTLSDGFYTFEIVNNRNRTTDFKVGDTKVGELAKGANAGALVTSTFENVRVSGGPKISVVKNGSTVTDNIDYVLAIKTAPLNVTATINPTYGYATFSSDYALDFTSVTNLTAWIATGANGDNVALEQVTGTVAAGTGLILNGASADIPVVAEGDTKSDNKLFAITSNYNLGKADNENYTNYVLAWQNSQVVFAPITGENYAPVVKGQAALCLQTSGSGGARALRISFGGITGVENVEAAAEATVKKNGAYLENGKIAIYKNGMKYNANGQLIK